MEAEQVGRLKLEAHPCCHCEVNVFLVIAPLCLCSADAPIFKWRSFGFTFETDPILPLFRLGFLEVEWMSWQGLVEEVADLRVHCDDRDVVNGQAD